MCKRRWEGASQDSVEDTGGLARLGTFPENSKPTVILGHFVSIVRIAPPGGEQRYVGRKLMGMKAGREGALFV